MRSLFINLVVTAPPVPNPESRLPSEFSRAIPEDRLTIRAEGAAQDELPVRLKTDSLNRRVSLAGRRAEIKWRIKEGPIDGPIDIEAGRLDLYVAGWPRGSRDDETPVRLEGARAVYSRDPAASEWAESQTNPKP
jgi:hypothetical protein